MTSESKDQNVSPQRVLVVEDDAATAELVRRTLMRAGYVVEIASGVQTGLKALLNGGTDGFDAMLLDYRLPDGEAWELADAAQERVPRVPVVFVTGMSDEQVAIEAVRRGVADYVKKTTGFWNELPAVLERVARLNQIKSRLEETSALMHAIVEHSSDLVGVCNGEGDLVYISPVCEILLGRHKGELQGQSWKVLVAEEDQGELQKVISRLDANPDEIMTVRCARKDGSFAWTEARAAQLKTFSSGEPLMVLTFHDVTEQKEHERQMQASLQEKEVLLREIYHRVKNNLQVIQSLLKMRARSLPEGETREAIDSTVQRVYAMALVHERLYQMEDLARLSISTYLNDLFEGVMASSTATPKQVKLALDTEDIPLTLDFAVPFGLLANELLSNSLKHGFPNGRRGTIDVSIHRLNGAVRMVVNDDGVGLPAGFDAAKSSSMGLKLAARLAHQLGGELQFSTSNGCRIAADLTRL